MHSPAPTWIPIGLLPMKTHESGEWDKNSRRSVQGVGRKRVPEPIGLACLSRMGRDTTVAEERVAALPEGEKPGLRDLSTPLVKIDDAGNIEVKLTVTSLSNERLEQLEALGMQIALTLPEYEIIEGSLPYDRVETVAGLNFVQRVEAPGYPWHD